MLDPVAPTPAIDAVSKKTPPSALALKIGNALRRRCTLALQLTAHIWGTSQYVRRWQISDCCRTNLIPLVLAIVKFSNVARHLGFKPL